MAIGELSVVIDRNPAKTHFHQLMTYTAAGASHIGLVRKKNEDEFFCDLESLVFAVADGLGGLPFGDLASKAAVQYLMSWANARKEDNWTGVDWAKFMMEVNQRVIVTGQLSAYGLSIGTTFSLGMIRGDVLEISHIGDSRIYLLRAEEVEQLTRDDTLETLALEQNQFPAGAEMPEHFKHTMTQCLGQQGFIEPQFSSHPLKSGDRILFCSDGISGYLESDEMAQIMTSETRPDTAVEKLIEKVLHYGAPDNATGIVVFSG